MTINFQVSFTRAVLVLRTQTAHFLSKMKSSVIKLNTLPNSCNWSLIGKLSWQKSVMRVDTKCQTHITPKNTFDPTQEAAKRWNSALLSVQQLPWRAEGMWSWWYFSKRCTPDRKICFQRINSGYPKQYGNNRVPFKLEINLSDIGGLVMMTPTMFLTTVLKTLRRRKF